jgi:hypothetical protein
VYRLAVPSAAARTVRSLRLDGPRSGHRSGVFPASHRTVHDLAIGLSFSSLLESRSRPLGEKDLKVLRVDRSPGASLDDVELSRN